jgi:hypothetical protein
MMARFTISALVAGLSVSAFVIGRWLGAIPYNEIESATVAIPVALFSKGLGPMFFFVVTQGALSLIGQMGEMSQQFLHSRTGPFTRATLLSLGPSISCFAGGVSGILLQTRVG